VDEEKHRISVDVRFDATQQRSPGQLLCYDIDFGATSGGEVRYARIATDSFTRGCYRIIIRMLVSHALRGAPLSCQVLTMKIIINTLKVRPGSKLLKQVWAKKQPHGAVAVFFLNADNATVHDVEVDLRTLGVGGAGESAGADGLGQMAVRDVWGKVDLPPVTKGAATYTVHAVPPQDSRFLLFSPV